MTAPSALATDPLIRAIAEGDCEDIVERMNRGCQCVSLDHARLKAELERDPRDGALLATINATRPHLFADSVAFVAERHLDAAAALVEAVDHVVNSAGWQSAALAHAPASARIPCAASGVFLGFDFHLGTDGPRLIEINTNAGGGLLNVALARAQRACCAEVAPLAVRSPGDPERAFFEMFVSEWRSVRGDAPLRTVAIVDREPQSQYLLPEFLLFQRLFERHGLKAWICDPAALQFVDGRLLLDGEEVDLVYNRLTDFSLDEPESAALAAAWKSQAALITPHPRAHALYADKGNLALLCDDQFLQTLGVDAATRGVLVQGIPRTVRVRAEDGDSLWKNRRDLFFKPATGYGSRAAYRGDKLTRSVFANILAGDYIAQALVPPSARRLSVEGVATDLKMDLRVYAYRGAVQLAAARLYRGQTTNFRTPGGGFATVVALPCVQRGA
ncbi:hypothetical protein U5817_13765 [Aromatoleum evansii]|uniref:Circularly permuted type 2 ATP-grasp protein n=1 Tax=Aromatoleum evansii TaxID=59406 RepID=A0ABZ1AIS6_AROEV|nr:hypothetical protein U5817_13765 [Aromatoleum evansii]